MKKNLVISSVAAIAAINPEGFTVNAANMIISTINIM